MTLKFAIPVLGALALMSALPNSAQARDRFDFSIGFGYSNYGRGGGYYNAGFNYATGPGYYSRGYRPSYYYAPAPRYYYAPAPVPVYRESYYYAPAPRYYNSDNCGYGYSSYRPVYRGGHNRNYYRN